MMNQYLREELKEINIRIIYLLSGELCLVDRAVLKALSNRRKVIFSSQFAVLRKQFLT